MLKSATKNQKGFAQILVLLLLLVAIPIGIYAVQHPTNILPFADEIIPTPPSISIKSPADQYSTVITSPITVVPTWTGTGVTSVVTYLEDQNGNNLSTINTTTNPKGNSVSFNFTIPKTTTTPNTLKLKSIVTTNATSNNTAESQVVTFKVTATDTNPPSVSLSGPGIVVSCPTDQPCASPSSAPNLTVTQGKKINLVANYSDDSGVNNLKLFRDDVQVGKDLGVAIPKNPTSYPISGSQKLTDDSKPAVGTYNYTVKAYDGTGNMTQSVAFPITITNSVPVITTQLIAPKNLVPDAQGVFTVSKGVTLTFHIDYSDDTGITKLDYFRDDTSLLSQTTNLSKAGVDKSDNTTNVDVTLGTHIYKAKASDSINQVTESTPIQVNIVPDSVIPTVSITSPITSTSAPYSVKSGSNMVIKTSESDDVGVIKIQYDVVDNGITTPLATKLAGTTPLTSDSLNFYVSGLLAPVKMAPGNHTISVKAYDVAGNMSTPANVYINVTSQ